MDEKYQKSAVFAGVAALLIVVIIIFTDVGAKFAKLGEINSNIMHNMMNATHGDPRDLEEVTVDFIKESTGSKIQVTESLLPKAFQPLKKVVHPPFGMGACQVCHAPRQKNPAAILYKTVAELCYQCHEPKLASNETPDVSFDCNKCHSPHHADRKLILRDKVIEKRCPVGKFVLTCKK